MRELAVAESEVDDCPAAYLLEVGEEILKPSHVIKIAEVSKKKRKMRLELARARIAIDFCRKPLSFQLQALTECWPIERITREMY